MILWFIIGFIVWILCVSFILAILKGGNPTRRAEEEGLDLRMKLSVKTPRVN